MVRMALLMVGILSVVARADDKQPEPAKPLTGEWVVESAEVAGRKVPGLNGRLIRLIAGTYHMELFGKLTEDGMCQNDPKAKPPAIDMTPTTGPAKGKTMPGIYEVAGDQLRICIDKSGKTRPTKFETSPDQPGMYLIVYKRKTN